MTEVKLNFKELKFWPDTEKVYFTYADIQNSPEWPDSPLLEIIGGDLYIVPSPSFLHQNIALNLATILRNYVKQNELGTICIAPLDVILSEMDVVDPDIFFIANEHLSNIQTDYVQCAPDLVIEILSKNRNRDLVKKKGLYEKYGVGEYWVVDPQNYTITLFSYNPSEQQYGEGTQLTSDDAIQSRILPDFSITVAEIFQD
ncbi:MAG TPA: Uma2 family endonuclease [Candidatus Lokiarchaeia archaeon]|nr:Uma2 family endonuclease [Candidatus Lokiarchaeia archaeon]